MTEAKRKMTDNENRRTLLIKHETTEEFAEGFGEQMESEDDQPHAVAFSDPDELGRIMTERRLELIEAVMTESPESIRDLAEILDRGLREAHEDVHMLKDRGILELKEEGRAKRPVIPYDNIRIEVDLPRAPV